MQLDVGHTPRRRRSQTHKLFLVEHAAAVQRVARSLAEDCLSELRSLRKVVVARRALARKAGVVCCTLQAHLPLFGYKRALLNSEQGMQQRLHYWVTALLPAAGAAVGGTSSALTADSRSRDDCRSRT